jgi:nuclear pore complex protein Nup188
VLSHILEPSDLALPGAESEDDAPYISSTESISQIQTFMTDAAVNTVATAGPAVFAWGIILSTIREISLSRKEAREIRQSQRAVEGFDAENESGSGRRASVGSEASLDAGIYEEVLENVMDTDLPDDPIQYLARSAVDNCNVFALLTNLSEHIGLTSRTSRLPVLGAKMRTTILDLVRNSLAYVDYIPEAVSAALAALTGGQRYWDILDQPHLSPAEDPLAIFISDDLLTNKLLHTAMSRYPYERLPFLKMIRALAACSNLYEEDGVPVAAKILESMSSFTYTLPTDFRDYETMQEEDNTNSIRLTCAVSLFEPRGGARFSQIPYNGIHQGLVPLDDTESFTIPVGTPGRIVSDSGPKVAVWFHEYSGLRYFGKLLETSLTGSNIVDATTGEVADRESVAEIIGLLATLLLSASRICAVDANISDARGAACRILEEASDGLSRNRDIITVVFNIFKEELQRQAGASGVYDLETLVACIQFIHAILPILPGRVWPVLGESGLLDLDGKGGRLASIVASTEIVSGHYEFLLSCAKLWDALVEDSVVNAVLRRSGSKAVSRPATFEGFGTGVPNLVLGKVILSFTRTFLDVLESASTWRFVNLEERVLLISRITSGFNNILKYSYSIDDSADLSSKITGMLAPAATHLVDSFLSETDDLSFQPILRAYLDGFCTPILPATSAEILWVAQVESTLSLCATLIKVGTYKDMPPSKLSSHLFKIAPVIARLYAAHHSYQALVLELFEALVINAASDKDEPPSLLGLLGPQTSKDFLGALQDLGRPLDHESHNISIWNLLSAVVSNRQQWFAIYILTGSTPRETLRKDAAKDKDISNERPILMAALDALTNFDTLTLPEALAMLRFVSLAQNFWPWAMTGLQKHTTFIKSISSFVSAQSFDVSLETPAAVTVNSYKIRMSAYIVEILAMYIYHSRQMGDSAPAKDVLSYLGAVPKKAVAVPEYNASLQGNLKRNFEARYPGCSLSNFKRTSLENHSYGADYFYDSDLAEKMLRSDQAWIGKKNDGLSGELSLANANMSLVDSEVVSES